jgi:hypothetical protein
MTKDEYISVCLKYSDYLNMTGCGDCYIKGSITMGLFQVTAVTWEDCIVDSNKIIGKIWYKCYSPDKKTIQTKPDDCHYADTKEDFEKYVQMFIENYKKAKVKFKKQEINKDFK